MKTGRRWRDGVCLTDRVSRGISVQEFDAKARLESSTQLLPSSVGRDSTRCLRAGNVKGCKLPGYKDYSEGRRGH